MITSLGFVENKVDHCIYLKTSGSKFIFLALYVDDTLLASSDVNLLHETKALLSKTFEMKDLGEASFVLGIEIHWDRSQNLLGLSQRAYVDQVLKPFNMETCKAGEMPVVKGDKLGKSHVLAMILKENQWRIFNMPVLLVVSCILKFAQGLT